jgi:tetratricopeptide (TPR) repeat protein
MRLCLCIAAGLGLAVSGHGAQEQTLFSPETAELFSTFGNHLIADQPQEADAAMTFLQAGILLDESSVLEYEQFLKGAGKVCGSQYDYSDTILLSLRKYLDQKADLEIAVQALRCVIEKANTRVQRETLLTRLAARIGQANPVFSSDVATELGLYAAEKADYTTALAQFEQACRLNKYNLLAYSRMVELRGSQETGAVVRDKLIYLRLRLAVSPADLEAVVDFGHTAYAAQMYPLAADAFEYAAGLYAWLSPNTSPSDDIFVSWAQSCYFIPARQTQCITLADQLRATGRLNLALDSVAALAAGKMGKKQQQEQILSEAASRAEEHLAAGLDDITPAGLGWFYCFVLEDAEKAAAYCNRAFTKNPEDPTAKSLMAYAFYLNNQDGLAREYSQAVDPNTPAAAMTLATLDIRDQQKQKALRRLRDLLDNYEMPLAIQIRAVELLKQCGFDYSRDLPIESIRKDLTDQFGEKIIPVFAGVDKLFSARLNFNGSEFSYGSTIETQLVMTNTGSIPMIINRQGLFTGNYRVDAVIGGDINVTIPRLIEGIFRPTRPVLPGESVSVRVDTNTGQLRKLLFTCPQASLEIKFVLYLNPVQAEDQAVVCGIPGVKPIEAVIRRKGIALTSEYLTGRLDTLTKGQEGLKIRSAELFAGLYAEQMAYQAGTIRYRRTRPETVLLTDAVRRALLDDNWKVRVQTLVLLSGNSVPLDYSMTLSVSENLNHEHWPVRMAAMWLLADQQKDAFQSVLDWNAQYDPFWLNRQLAVALGGKESKPRPAQNPAGRDPNDVPKQAEKIVGKIF